MPCHGPPRSPSGPTPPSSAACRRHCTGSRSETRTCGCHTGHIIAAVCEAANAAGKAATQASHPTLHSAWQHLSPQDRGAAAGQMANLSVITALDTARRLLIEANTAPRPQPLDPVLQQAAEMALHVAAEYRNQIGPALDRFSP